jgi:UDP-N-acetylmuramate: L-alanyl-gamma-D-glutamyl-meso-diaminopimelate ligase
MPKDYFAAERTVSLSDLKPGARIHVIGVSGVAMAQLAVALSQAGYEVSGSDKEFYEPMGSYLGGSKVKLCRGYDAKNIPANVDAVVIGNAVSYGHTEVDAVEQKKYPYSFFPKLLHELIIKGRHSVVVAGTHGKSTTSAILATVLSRLGVEPSYFVGGVVRDLPESLHRGAGKVSVVEGDEYDSAFFAKVPKFNFYDPQTFIVTSVEYDHADIYPSLESINSVFTNQVLRLPNDARVVSCIDGENLRNLTADWKKKAKCQVITYGEREECDYRLLGVSVASGGQLVRVKSPKGEATWNLQIPGAHNALNSIAVVAVCDALNFSREKVFDALKNFQGVKRRQELRYGKNDIAIIEDFAHHPTAVKETIAAVRQAYPGKRLWAVFEPRSNTSRKKVFQIPYVAAFAGADLAVLCQVAARSNDTANDLIDVEDLGRSISANGTACRVLATPKAIEDCLISEMKQGDVVLIMSNGSFGGLIDALLKRMA